LFFVSQILRFNNNYLKGNNEYEHLEELERNMLFGENAPFPHSIKIAFI